MINWLIKYAVLVVVIVGIVGIAAVKGGLAIGSWWTTKRRMC